MSKALNKYINEIKGKNIIHESKKIIKDNQETLVDIIKISSKQSSNEKVLDTNTNLRKNYDIDVNYKVTVRLYMTKPDSNNFTFHRTWNNGVEMPLRIMYGTIIQQTKTMVKMSLKADITAGEYCLKCGRYLTNEISKLYGLGPECGHHYYINPLSTEEFNKHKEAIKNKMNEITWTGWIPKVAIISMEAQ